MFLPPPFNDVALILMRGWRCLQLDAAHKPHLIVLGRRPRKAVYYKLATYCATVSWNAPIADIDVFVHSVRAMQILAPIELEFIFEKDYFQHLTEHAPAYMAALVLLEHSHSDAAAMDLQQAHAMPSPIVPAPPGQETLQQQQQQLSSEQQGTGKKGGKGRGRGVATGGKAKRRRTTASAPLDTDMSFDVVPHVAPSQTYGGHMGVPDPTVCLLSL